MFPFLSYRSEKQDTDLALLKGLVRYRKHDETKELRFLWLPFGMSGGTGTPDQRQCRDGYEEWK